MRGGVNDSRNDEDFEQYGGFAIWSLPWSSQWDAGLGIRAFAKGLVVRIDTAVSDEGVWVQMMVNQPFQF